ERIFKENKETKVTTFDDTVIECGIMGVVVFIPTAMQSDGTRADIIFMDEL
ncbi:hypothetical protein M9458_030218, partial [Cirrhinus mrigala]